jgi:protein TonB
MVGRSHSRNAVVSIDPFAAFPPDIAREIDILAITRTWSFTTAEQFQGQ